MFLADRTNGRAYATVLRSLTVSRRALATVSTVTEATGQQPL